MAEHEPAPSAWQKDACAEQTVPMAPESMAWRIARMAGKKRDHTPCRKKRPRSRARLRTRLASSAVGAMLFSQSTCLPASRHRSESGTCREDGVAM
eukprot:scaffold19757_cov113-Isochrysis_galbana.AAC.7